MASAQQLADFGALTDLFAKAEVEAQSRGTSGGDKSAGLIAKPTKVVKLGEQTAIDDEESQRVEKDAQNNDDIWTEGEVDTPHMAALKATDDGRPQPDYDIVFKQRVGSENVYFGMGDVDPSSNSCSEIVIKIKLPNQQMKDLDLDVQRQSLVLSSPDFRLATYLPYPVDHERGAAKWDSATHTLSVTLPIVDE
eukprot:CAMPEP_0171522438 /NCGR_PEP_ID=MMETSP0959-20130129/7752_1 /TAXON_ID=87120 /ORGANISM="Aurantiochytrium limacinum, Strain ATCCMYA-1381" /LENGTH=193 /DNA_ID=CAMNT_0012062579 /DNA_START=51 /DNA_END=632 /DNA_ORIENTATION=-